MVVGLCVWRVLMAESGLEADRRRLNALSNPDGSVTIPLRLVGWVRSSLDGALQELRRAGRGGALAGDVLDVLDALAESADNGSVLPGAVSLKVIGQFVTVAEAARVLECGDRAVRLALQEHRLDGVKTGARHWLIDSEELERFRFTKGAHRGNKED